MGERRRAERALPPGDLAKGRGIVTLRFSTLLGFGRSIYPPSKVELIGSDWATNEEVVQDLNMELDW